MVEAVRLSMSRPSARTRGRRPGDRRPSPSQAAARSRPAPPPPKPRRRRTLSAAAAGAVIFAAGLVLGGLWGRSPFPPEALAALNPSPSEVVRADSRGMRAVIDALKSRERALDRRERSIEARESDLRQVEAELDARLAELQELRETLKGLLEESDEVREARIRQLTKMVESMRSKQAAGVFAELDNELAVEVLRRMNKAKAGKALAAMEPARAAALGELLTRSPVQEMP